MNSLSNFKFSKLVVKNTQTNKMRFLLRQTALSIGLSLFLDQSALAAIFYMPQGNDSLIDNNNGEPYYVTAKQEESLIDIAVNFLLGQEEVVRANKGVDRWLPKAGTKVRIPTSYLLPDAPRQGVVINLPEYRLYYYFPSNQPGTPGKVISYSVGIGRVDWKTPLGFTKVIGKVKNPTWTPPASIKAEHLAKGDPLPDVWPAGADNPLGLFAFRLGIPGYLLHSTNKPQGVGMQVSHGCMRLYPKDIEQLFPILNIGTAVNIINQPVKVGWSNNKLYIESHPNLEGEEISVADRLQLALSLIENAKLSQSVILDNQALETALNESNGLPTVIGVQDNSLSTPPVDLENLESNRSTGLPVLDAPPVLPDSSVRKASPEQKVPVARKKTLPFPKLDESEGVVPRSEIEEELRREEMQEREFRNSPFPHY
jgi:L,D-transpeptidase ErfK/SrfK